MARSRPRSDYYLVTSSGLFQGGIGKHVSTDSYQGLTKQELIYVLDMGDGQTLTIHPDHLRKLSFEEYCVYELLEG